VNYPFIYYPSFYLAQEVITAKNHCRKFQAEFAFEKWRTNVVVDIAACSAFWIPANGLNFLFVPIHWRVPYIAVVGLGWLSALSWLRGNNKLEPPGKEAKYTDESGASG
jgi:hypothetical protein